MNAVITGASKGIGLAIANLFLEKNIDIAICSRNIDDLENLKAKWLERFPERKIHLFPCDVSKREEVEKFAEFCLNQFSTIDILVNNAGVFLPGEIHKEEDGTLERQIETNLYSAYHLSRALIPNMISNKRGNIINMCSIASKIAYPNGGSYSISKFALLGFSKVLREELKDKGIRVNSILPGATWSDSWKGVDLPYERLIEAEDIAKTVWACIELGDAAVIEEVIIRPQLGDL